MHVAIETIAIVPLHAQQMPVLTLNRLVSFHIVILYWKIEFIRGMLAKAVLWIRISTTLVAKLLWILLLLLYFRLVMLVLIYFIKRTIFLEEVSLQIFFGTKLGIDRLYIQYRTNW